MLVEQNTSQKVAQMNDISCFGKDIGSAIPKLSVIVPVYNVEKYLPKCLDSIIHQTMKDLEIICINDASEDNSPEILKTYAKKDNRIKIISLEQNLGPGNARNLGVKIAQGEYIGFVDSDDWIDNNFYEKLYNTIVEYNADIACATIIRKRENSEKYRVLYTEEKLCLSLNEKIECIDLPKCSYVWNKLYKKDKIKNIKFKNDIYYEDVFWTPEVLKNTNSLVTVAGTNYYYRVNKNSIVKNLKSKKRQLDNYNAQKFINKFFEKNHLILDKKYKNITKSIKYLGDIPLLKIKEKNNTQTYLLFSFIPIFIKNTKKRNLFDIKYLDSHYFINLFGLTIRIKAKENISLYRTLDEFGLNQTETREPKIIASLTSFPQRITTLHYVIESLLTQSVKPDKLILWLGKEQFPNLEKDLPESLLKLIDYGLTIRWCEDLKSYKKLIPALKEYPEDIIITFDDDIYYDEYTIEDLYNAYLNNNKNIYTNRGFRVKLTNRGLSFYHSKDVIWDWKQYADASYYNTIIGCGGVLYPPKSLYKEIFDTEKFNKILPTQDDIYFWAMAVLQGTKIQMVNGYSKSVEVIDDTQQYGLCKINLNRGNGLSGNQALDKIVNEFPELIDRLKEEQC